MPYAEQITAFENKRAANMARQKAIMDAATAEGATLDAAQQEEFDNLDADMDVIDDHLKRLRTMEKREALSAVPVVGYTREEGEASRGGSPIIVKAQPKLAPGIEFTRLFKSMAMARGDMSLAMRIAKNVYGEDSNAAGTLLKLWERGAQTLQYSGAEKNNIVAGSTLDGTWAADMVLDEGGAFADFAEYLRPQTIVGKFGVGGIPALNRIPFRTAVGIVTQGATGYWVGEGKPKPLTNIDTDKSFLEPLKCANIAVVTEELVMSANISAEQLLRNELVKALVYLIDVGFIDPANGGTANIKPASVTNGAVAIAASGSGDADDIRQDIRNLIQVFINANNEAAGIVLVMRPGDALAAGMMTNGLGQAEFPGIGIGGGTIMPGLSVITSQAVVSGNVVAIAPGEIYFADDDGFRLDVSREASLQMLDNPTNDTVTPTPTSMVSMFQTNSIAFRAERILNWTKRRSSATAYLTGVAWGGGTNT